MAAKKEQRCDMCWDDGLGPCADCRHEQVAQEVERQERDGRPVAEVSP